MTLDGLGVETPDDARHGGRRGGDALVGNDIDQHETAEHHDGENAEFLPRAKCSSWW
jgi:hypothetical protein